MSNAYGQLVAELKAIGVLGSISSIIGWDERVNLPPKGAELRARQSAMLATMLHERISSPRLRDLLAETEGLDVVRDPDSDAAVNVRETRRTSDRAAKLPSSLVEEQARTAVLSEQAWVEARRKSSFAEFQPWLEKTLDLKKQEADCVGYKDHPYDALIDEYEPGQTTAGIHDVFESLRDPLIALVRAIAAAPRQAPLEILERDYPAALQEKFSREAAARIGFDFAAGRLDIAVHPFCSGIGPGDTRMTTRYDEKFFGDAFFGTLHESGHAMYEQGLPPEHFGTPRGRAVSLGVHESQSRLWENFVGRSRPFWQFFMPRAREVFGATLKGVSDDDWLFAVNDVRPSLIRTESDEVTYNLHVLLRFDLETAMMDGSLAAGDIPAAWNERMQKYLGVKVPDDARGCLQDVHWSGGGIGYFPTYTLGNLCAAQFFEQAKMDRPGLESEFARGDFSGLLSWLRERIHSQGQRYAPPELMRQVTGRPLSAEPLLAHLRAKAADLYRV